MRVVIAEDGALFREGLVRLLEEAGHEVIAAVADADALLEAVSADVPDLAVIDIRMPPTLTDDGARAAKELRALHPDLPMLLLSQHVERRYSVELVAAGGFGYLLKDRVLHVSDFLAALERVATGGSALDPEVVRSLVAAARWDDPISELTPREREVLTLVAEGLSNNAIAAALVVAERTVESHMRGIFQKLRIPDAADHHRRVTAVLAYMRSHSASASTPEGGR